MFIPYSTDAPLYHAPIATTSLIVVNILLFFLWPVQVPDQSYLAAAMWAEAQQAHDAGAIGEEEWKQLTDMLGDPPADQDANGAAPDFDWRTLHYGDGIKPWQWLTGNFMHADFLQLLGNMLILWPFGALIEGKIGWKKFLLLYAGIGVVYSAIGQFLFLFIATPSYSLGASAIIFGLIAIALVWAPINEVNCLLLIGFRPLEFAVPISVYCAFSIVIEMFISYYTSSADEGGILSSSFHLFGAVIGLGVGTMMIRQKWVDCENYDFYTVYFGNPDAPPEAEVDTAGRHAAQQRSTQLGLQQIHQILQEGGDPALAYRAHQKLGHSHANWHLPEADLLAIIQAYLNQKRSADALPAMIEYVRRGGNRQFAVRLRIAHVLLETESRPAQALQVLAKIEPEQLNPQDRQRYELLQKQAQEMRAAGVIEPAAEDI